jgi:hypothetical protein
MSNRSGIFALMLGSLAAFGLTAHADELPMSLKQHRIGYVATDLHWSVYQSADVNADCPEGLNGNGPRENFKALYPNGGSVENTQLVREALRVFPSDRPAQFPYILAQGATAIGLDLDGKADTGFKSPSGEPGIDNNLFKVLGCNAHYRGPEGQQQLFANKFVRGIRFDRIMIEISGLDDLTHDQDVEVIIYRGRDPLLLDATGEGVAPGGTQRVDLHYGKTLVQHLRGKLSKGILTTEPIDGLWPWSNYFDRPAVLRIHDMRFRLTLTPTSANGLIAGYTDVDSFYRWVTGWSTHHLSYGRLDPAEFYWAVKNNADAYPDSSGKMTAISSAISIGMAQVFIEHPQATEASAIASTAANGGG